VVSVTSLQPYSRISRQIQEQKQTIFMNAVSIFMKKTGVKRNFNILLFLLNGGKGQSSDLYV
jgi:hypothetical protein